MSSLDKLEALIPHRDRASSEVSKWSVGMQIQHCLISTKAILDAVADSEPGAEKPTFSLPRLVVLTLGRIPRGKGKAPKASHPEPSPSEEVLRQSLQEARESARRARGAEKDAYWRHFVFGVMRRDTALKFVEIHNKHHMRIVDDILKKS